MIEIDNRRVKIIHIYTPTEDEYDWDTGELVNVWVKEGAYKRLVFDSGDDLYVDDIAMYGSRLDGMLARPLSYEYEGKTYLTMTSEDVKFQTMH